jgi:cytochrome c5
MERSLQESQVSKSMLKRIASVVAVFGLGAVLSLSSHALTDKQKKDIEARIKPVGSVCLEGDSSCGGAVASAGGAPKSGEDVYKASCVACHDAGIGGAPKFGDKGQWKPRLAKGVDTLHTNAITGINAMPPKGTCMSCSDDEIKAAVDYILAKSK